MSRVCDFTGKKRSIQRSHRHKSGKSRAGAKAFAYKGPQGLRGVKKLKVQGINLVTVRTSAGKYKVSMKVYKTYFKKQYKNIGNELSLDTANNVDSKSVSEKINS